MWFAYTLHSFLPSFVRPIYSRFPGKARFAYNAVYTHFIPCGAVDARGDREYGFGTISESKDALKLFLLRKIYVWQT
jgi:hypothetical protein